MKSLLVFVLLFASTLSAAPRRYVVEFTAAAPKRLRADTAGTAVIHHEFRHAFHGAAVELREGQSVESLRRLPYVAAVHEDTEVVAHSVAGARASSVRVASGRAAATLRNGAGIVVAVIDTGIDATHPALAGKVIGGHDFINGDDDATDDHGHGTHVAGIIAAESTEMTGVAPGVLLLAYKVLDAQGRGTMSAVVAALERALDPNGDGDTSDRVDIANLSLGDRGHPNDPMARAVDNAVAAGVVVCVSAGNDETFHRIGSPAGAARAITVGASTTEDGVPTVAYFTSRGPATGTGAIKPDLLAPGRDILSLALNHGYRTASGTSMAAPYVSGLAALLLEEHPDWTPDRIKAALVTTATAVAAEEVMTQGTGVVHLPRARLSTLVASPTQVNFGLNGVTASSWSSARRITLHNDGATPRTVRASIEGASAAMTIVATPAEVTIGAGASADIEIRLDVDNAALGQPPTGSFSFGGVLVLAANGEVVRVPWAFVRAARATIANDGGPASVLWRTDAPRYASAVSIGSGGLELLIAPGVADFVVASVLGDEMRLVIAEQQNVTGDVALTVTAAHAPHEHRLAGTDEGGTPFPDGDGTRTLRSPLLRLLLPDGRTIALPDITGRIVRTSTFSARYGVLATEAFVDRDAGRIYLAQYPPLRDVSAGSVLRLAPSEYASQKVVLHFPPGPRREVGVMPRDWPRNPLEHRPMPPLLRFPAEGATWHGTLFMTKEVHEAIAGGVQLGLYTDANVQAPATLTTPAIRRNADGFFATWGYSEDVLPTGTVAGEPMTFGQGPVHVAAPFQADAEWIVGDGEILGHRGDRRRAETTRGTIRVFDEAGREVSSGPVTPGWFFLALPRAGKLAAEVRYPSIALDGRGGEALLTARFDTRAGAASMPSITSMAILDGLGRQSTRLPAGGNGSLIFSAADHELGEYRRIATSATKVFFRRHGSAEWHALNAVATGEEETSDETTRRPSGVVYRVDLGEVLSAAGDYDLALEIGDEQGNSVRWQVTPALLVDPAPGGGRRRSAGR
ncbi:MAG TPA: S8 family serine peptidase [Thermoanaerobaculia bacterium]